MNHVPIHREQDDEFDDMDDGEECGDMGDGTCLMMGTEYCDFDCPYRADFNADQRRRIEAAKLETE